MRAGCYLDEKPVHFASPGRRYPARHRLYFPGAFVLPDLSVSDNIFIADPPKRFGLIDRRDNGNPLVTFCAEIGCPDIHPLERVKDLPLSRQQMVEIAKALVRQPRLIIMDEATSALTAKDVEQLYKVIRQLRDRGLAILYISHRMHEIAALADICSVFRNGRHIDTFPDGDPNHGGNRPSDDRTRCEPGLSAKTDLQWKPPAAFREDIEAEVSLPVSALADD